MRRGKSAWAAGIALFIVGQEGHAVFATPFADVPAAHWAYQDIERLAADGLIDGYPDGKFLGDRKPTRYEVAVMLARVVAKLKAHPDMVSQEDLAKLQKLLDAFKDELDGLGVRVTDLEGTVRDLDERTKVAQRFFFHGDIRNNFFLRERVRQGALVDHSGPADPLVGAYLYTDASNAPISYADPGAFIFTNSRFTFGYVVNDNLTVSLPVHVFSLGYGGSYATNEGVNIWPTIDVDVKHAGALDHLDIRAGVLDDFLSSRTGLAFSAPTGTDVGTLQNAMQPDQKGLSLRATLQGLTDFRVSFSRLDQTYLNTQPSVLDPAGTYGDYLTPIVPNQYGYTVAGPNGASGVTSANQTDTFGPSSGSLTQVYLSKKAVMGTIYVSGYNGASYTVNGACSAPCPAGAPATAPPFVYNNALNAVVFMSALPAGATVRLTYVGASGTVNAAPERYMVNGRINHKFKNIPGAEVGLTFNRIFDFNNLAANNGITTASAAAVTGMGLVSDTVFGLDFQVPLWRAIDGPGSQPFLFAEAATSNYTNNYDVVPPVFDAAGVVGLKWKTRHADLSVRYQSVGVHYLDGAQLQYYGNPPALLSGYGTAYLPDFMGFSNTLGLNQQYAAQPGVTPGSAAAGLAGNGQYTYIYPAYNPFRGSGPFFFQAFTPNSRGFTGNLSIPAAIAGYPIKTRWTYEHLWEIAPNSLMGTVFGTNFASHTPMTLDGVSGGAGFTVPILGEKAAFDLTGSLERLNRPDETLFPYAPFMLNNGTGQVTVANSGTVAFYPNYVHVNHSTWAAAVTLPVGNDVSVGATYNVQRFGGSYAPPGNGGIPAQNMSQHKIALGGNLTYNIPNTSSSITFQTYNYRYVDDVMPSYTTYWNEQNLGFAVRF